MNESTLLKLKVIVERAVRPVEATIYRKRKMREELLAHVTGVFEDELPRCGDEASALIQVEKRFGDPSELARKLQETVPTIDRVEFLVSRLIAPRDGESALRRAIRFGIISIASFLCLTLPLTVFVILFWAKPAMLGKSLLGICFASLACGAMIFLATLHSNSLQNTLFNVSRRSLIKGGGGLILASCLIPIVLPLVCAVAVSPFMSVADCGVFGFTFLKEIWSLIILIPLASVIVAKLISDEKRYVHEWAKLEID